MHKQTLQLPIHDPFGFADYQSFTEAVGQALSNSNRVAPQPHNDFNPIRTGILKIRQLRLVDTFGQVQALTFKQDRVITTDAMAVPGNPHLVVLPRRLVQPARLNFRWLSAERGFMPESAQSNTNGRGDRSTLTTASQNSNLAADEVKMNDHPATTPVCGWLLPNNLDNSLMVYDAQGQALGLIAQEGYWVSAPGRQSITFGEIAKANFHLYQFINHMINQGGDFLNVFLRVVENALDGIDPENAAQHEAIALLMGRPLAVVRERLDLELQGLPAFDRGWNVFRQEVECEAQGISNLHRSVNRQTGAETILRETENFTQVQFPIRLGEYRQLNDGLVGFWQEKNGSYETDFYINDSTSGKGNSPKLPTHKNIHYYADAPDIFQSIDSPPQILTMLVDPRGSVHATSGILPTKSIRIPSAQFAEALRRIEVTFLSAPILSDRGHINLPLPAEPGYVWSWLEKENGVWDSERKIGTVNSQATFSAPQVIF